MQKATIYHVSDGRAFPLEFRDKGPVHLALQECPPDSLDSIRPNPDQLALIRIQGEEGQLDDIVARVRTARHLNDLPKVLLLAEEDYAEAIKKVALLPRTVLLDDSIRPFHLQLILELIVQQEYYRQVVYQLSHDSRQRGEVFENLMELGRRELKRSREESDAYRALVEYETEIRKSEKGISGAVDVVGRLKEQELLSLKTQLQATERLSQFRDNELREAREQIHAQEEVLNMSRRENIERDKIINALDRLRIYTDKELMDLFHENNELRRRLGMPPR